MKHVFLLSILMAFATIACKKDTEETPEDPVDQNETNLPDAVKGQVILFEYTFDNGGSNYVLNQQVQFTFSSSGALFIDQDPDAANGDELSLSGVYLDGNEYKWDDSNNDHNYALSTKSDGSVNEINLSRLSSGTFIGQFEPLSNDTTGGGTGGENGVTVSGDFDKVGGENFDPGQMNQTTSNGLTTYSWTQQNASGPNTVLRIQETTQSSASIEMSASSAFSANGNFSALGIEKDTVNGTFTFNGLVMNERFSQPGEITLNGTLSY